jgi:hypothetical protein
VKHKKVKLPKGCKVTEWCKKCGMPLWFEVSGTLKEVPPHCHCYDENEIHIGSK